MLLKDIYEARDIKLNEQKEGNKSGVLGVVEGVFFLPNVPSRNGRVYPDSLWENVLKNEDVKRLLSNRSMLGTVGHEDLDFDALVREQKVSHVVTDLKIDENGKGQGRAEILDTPVGRILYTLLKNGSKISVSSKGWGEYKGTNDEGMSIVDESSFVFERFDFVVDPGFLDATPTLKKQYENAISDFKNNKEDYRMEIVDVLIKEKMELQEKLNKVMEELKKVEQEKDKLNENIKVLKARQTSIINESNKKDKKLNILAEKYIGVSDDTEIAKEMRMLSNLITSEANKLVKIGVNENALKDESLSSILAKIFLQKDEITKAVVQEHNQLGESIDRKTHRLLENANMKYEELLKNSKREKIKLLETKDREIERTKAQYERAILKMKKPLREAKRIMTVVDSLGGLQGIVGSLKKANKIIHYITEKKVIEESNKLSAVYGIGKDEARTLIERVGIKKANAMLKAGKRDFTESKVVVGESKKKILSEGMASRLMDTVFYINEDKK